MDNVLEGVVTERLELPSGGWVEVADASKIRAKHRKRVLDQLNIDRMQSKTIGSGLDVVDGLMLMMIDKWDIEYLPGVARPMDWPESIGELTIPDYDALSAAMEPARKVLFPDPVTVDDHAKPGSPTLPAGE
jgi:hypothetical protein